MTEQEVTKRLREAADDADDIAEEHLRKARASKVAGIEQTERFAATAARGNALFFRQLADAIEFNMPTTEKPVFDTVTG